MNILLIPTTDNIVLNWSEVYKYCINNGAKVYIIIDNILIEKQIPKEFKKLDLYLMRMHQLEKLNLFKKLILLIYLNFYAKHILKTYKIDCVVVSNDNPFTQNVFVNIANKLGIYTVLHQASGILKKTENSNIRKIKNYIYKLVFNFNPTENIGTNVKECFLQGNMWIKYIDNKNYTIVGNQYYYDLKRNLKNIDSKEIDYFKAKYQLDGKYIVTFFSQPFKELKLSTEKNIDRLYRDIEKISKYISEKMVFIFKPHPQEKHYKKYNIKGLIIEDDLNSILLASDITISIFSTMAIQSKIANKTTIGYLPNYLSKEQVLQMKEVFDQNFSNYKDLISCIIDSRCKKSKRDFNDVVDLSLNTKEILCKLLKEKVKL